MSMPPGTVCAVCDRRHEPSPTEPWRCRCGGPLEFPERPPPTGTRPTLEAIDPTRGLWAFAEDIPIEPHATLGEGFTPLVSAPEWDCSFKLDYVTPTGSFKDRGATTTVSRAVELGVDRLVEDSSGNAGAAIATYAARAGLAAEIYVPAAASPAKLAAIERVGATPVPVEGDRAAVTAACLDAVESGGAWYASHAWNPAFFAGTMTAAFEIAIQRDWRLPDAVVTPVGHGTMLLGLARGFDRLAAAGWIDDRPRLLGVQAAGYAPLAEALDGPTDGSNELAAGVHIAEPARRDQLLDAIRAANGHAIALDTPPVERALDRLRRGGFYVEPTSALGPAGLAAFRERDLLEAADDVVVILTGSGLKS